VSVLPPSEIRLLIATRSVKSFIAY